MKKLFMLTVLIFFGIVIQANGQKLAENKVDDFTNNSVKRTSWETINMDMKFTAYFRLSKINDAMYFDLKMMIGGGVFAIGEDQELMFKLKDGQIVKLKNLEHTITCRGCGANGLSGSNAHGLKVSYLITAEQAGLLTDSVVEKIRIYTTDGYVEDDLNSKTNSKIQRALALIE